MDKIENVLPESEHMNGTSRAGIIPYGEALSANAENDAGVTCNRRRRISSTITKILSLILALVGVMGYVGIGYIGFEYMRDGGFARIVAAAVFGGVVDKISPLEQTEDSPAEEDDSVNSANAENIQVITEDIGCDDYTEVLNETDYDPDDIMVPASSIVPEYNGEAAVLVIHTHATESYAPADGKITADENFRDPSPENNMISVGSAFVEILEGKGISAYHCKEMFDAESYIDAYARSAAAVKRYLTEHPKIKYVIDIHRDAVIRADGTVIRTDGGEGAQLMLVCGTDEMGADFPKWEKNFAFSGEYQRMLSEKYPKSVRHMNLRSASFNQQLAERYLLLEVGSCGNSLEEAKAAARKAAEVFCELITGR